MTSPTHSNGRTDKAAAEVFAEVMPGVKAMLAKRYEQPVVDAFIERITGLQEHPKFSGLSADAVRATLDRSLKPVSLENGTIPMRMPLERVTAEHILKHVPNVNAPAQKAEVRENIVDMLKERAKAPLSQAASTVSNAAHSGRFGPQDYLLMGMSALAAAISICHGIGSMWQASSIDKEDPLAPKVSSSTYMMAAAEVLLGAGMAALAHHQYKNPIGAHL